MKSTVSSARHAWDPVAGSDDGVDGSDDDDGGVSVAVSRASVPSGAPPSAGVSSSGPKKGPWGNTSRTLVSPITSSRTAADSLSAASGASGRSEWPSVSGDSRPPTKSAASATTNSRSNADKHSQSAASDARSATSFSSAQTRGGGLTTPSVSSSQGNNFPTFANTEWGDAIAVALSKEKPMSKKTKKRQNKVKNVLAQAQALQQERRADLLEPELPPGGPGSSWGGSNDPW